MTSLASLAEAGRLSSGVELAPMTTYRVGGPARWFLEAESERDLIDLVEALRSEPAEVLILGRGSNVVVSDRGFDGVVVHLGRGLGGLTIGEDGLAVAGAALSQAALARGTAAQGRGGLEFMVGIPGSVGGAVRMNAGCWGTDTSEWLVSARVFDFGSGTATDRPVESLDLRYRHSNLAGSDAVIGATFRTVERSRPECEATLREITRWRRDHQPGGTFNAGSVFKNPEGDFAGRIIDDLGLKGLRIGGVVVSERHANFFVAEPGSAAQHIHDLVEAVKERVLAETGIALEPEMRFAGEFGDPA